VATVDGQKFTVPILKKYFRARTRFMLQAVKAPEKSASARTNHFLNPLRGKRSSNFK